MLKSELCKVSYILLIEALFEVNFADKANRVKCYGTNKKALTRNSQHNKIDTEKDAINIERFIFGMIWMCLFNYKTYLQQTLSFCLSFNKDDVLDWDVFNHINFSDYVGPIKYIICYNISKCRYVKISTIIQMYMRTNTSDRLPTALHIKSCIHNILPLLQ